MHQRLPGRKSRNAVREERDAVLSILDAAQRALSRQEIREQYRHQRGVSIAYNTVKARLDELVAEGRIVQSAENRRPAMYEIDRGKLTAAADHIPSRTDGEPKELRLTPGEDVGFQIPLSPDAKGVQELLRRPRAERSPVGYKMDFLDRYEPGVTWYLETSLRERLHHLGSTTYMDQPAGTYARDIMQRLIIDLSWGSSQLEGLRYSRIDTAELLNAGRSPSGASDRDRQLILNHKAAIEFLVEQAQSIAFDKYTLMNLHALLAENLLDRREEEGALRTRPVVIGTSVYTPTAIPQVIDERFGTLLAKAEAIPDPIEQSFFVMVHIPYLQPFIDVNKRTSRLAANIPLIRANLCPLSFVDVTESLYTEGVLAVYELTEINILRDVYAWAYERSCAEFAVLREAMGEPDPIRLNYRTELREIVTTVVRGRSLPTDEQLRERGRELGVPASDLQRVAVEARKDLTSLRPDVLARYSLRKSEYDAWADAQGERQMKSDL